CGGAGGRGRRTLLRLLSSRLELRTQGSSSTGVLVEVGPGFAGGDGLDASHARTDRALGEDREWSDLGRRADVRSPAELERVPGDLDDAHDVSVLLAEEHRRTEATRLVDRSLEDVDGSVLEDLLIDDPLDAVPLFRRQRLLVREVEAQLVRAHGRPRLAHVLAEHLA